MSRSPGPLLLLDSEALSLLVGGDQAMLARVDQARRTGGFAVVSALMIVETAHGRTDLKRLDWFLSRLQVEGVLPEDARVAVRLLRDAGGLHGHQHSIDGLLAALAVRLAEDVVVVTSDPDDWRRLLGNSVGVITV